MVKIFVGNVASETTEDELRALFEEHGTVSDCDILKNYGFVHMNDEEEAQKAVAALHKHLLNGSRITVEYATTKVRNATKIYVGNLPEGVTVAKVRELFRPYGKVVECDIVKNYAFVHMQRENEALKAIKELSNLKMEGQKVYVCLSRSNPPKNARDDYYFPPPAPHYPPFPQPPPYPSPRTPVSDFYPPRGRLPPPPPLPPPASRSLYEHEPYERSIRRDPYAAAAANSSHYYEQDPYERRLAPPQRPQPTSIASRYYRDRSPLGSSRSLLPPPPPPPPPPASYMRSYARGPSSATPPPPSSSVPPTSSYRRYPLSSAYEKDDYMEDKYRNGYSRGY